MATSDLALTRPDPTLTIDTLRAQMEAAKRFVDSGLLPSGIKTPQQALTIMQAGREIGVPPTYALRNIHVISGKPVASAELLMALVRRTYGQSAIRVKEATPTSCTVEYREQGWDGVSSLTFTIEDAERAKLSGKDTWKAYPRAMLRSRAVSEAVRTAFPECIAGLYTPEEMGADVVVTADGGVEIAPAHSEPATEPAKSKPAALATFVYASPDDREDAIDEYVRLADLAVTHGHKAANKIMQKDPRDLNDGELQASVQALSRWEAGLKPRVAVDAENAGEYDS